MTGTAAVVLLVGCVLTACFLAVWPLVLRRRLRLNDGHFRCLVRVDRGSITGLPVRQHGTPCLAHWAHDVLLLHQGTWLLRTHALPVHTTLDTFAPAPPADRVRRRQEAVVLVLCLDDGVHVSVTAPADAQELLAGPFAALAVRRTQTSAPRQPSD
jgi:hypothetical protein